MTPAEVRAAAAAGAVVLDLRQPRPFATEHVPGAVNFQFNRADLADRAEMALPRDVPFVVHAEPDPIGRVAGEILAQAGFDVRGTLAGGLRAWKAAGLDTTTLPLLTVEQLRQRRSAFRVLDTREGFEYRYGHIPGAELLEWTEAWDRADGVPAGAPLALVCGDQVRSAYVASVLLRAGKPAHLVFGGMVDWLERGYEVEKSSRT
ncbi:MAG TPA: rhodanese-like domain-containing protein [Gemmatimonadales bacterium]|nr:rhodanese-like domain-containing protein [Gemmatimonadales bacterium]